MKNVSDVAIIQAPLIYQMAGWQSGHAADCNSVNAGSIPTPASISLSPYASAYLDCPTGSAEHLAFTHTV